MVVGELGGLVERIERNRSKAGGRCCRVYGLYWEDAEEPWYIGSTCKSLAQRLAGHIREKGLTGTGVRIEEILEVDESERFEVERLAIRLGLAYGFELENRVWV